MNNTERFKNQPLFEVMDSSPEALLRQLEKGKIFKSRIVLQIDTNRYLLRISGYNLVMTSTRRFNRFDEIYIMVEETSPRLKVRYVDPFRLGISVENKKGKGTDFQV
jgi:hypothetical protein